MLDNKTIKDLIHKTKETLIWSKKYWDRSHQFGEVEYTVPEINEAFNNWNWAEKDLKEASALFGRSRFDVVTCNPPYMIGGHGIVNPADAKAIARHEVLCTLDDVAREAAAVLVPGGRLYMVHRPFRLAELMTTMSRHGLEPKRLRMVHPQADREPNLVLIACVRGGKSGLTVEKPLILADESGETTAEVKELYGF